MLGYRGNPQWRDMSEYVVHFTDGRQALVDILLNDRIDARTPFGWAREVDGEDATPTQRSVCLSEVPLDMLDRLVDRHGTHGLGFKRTDLLQDQAAPVWYVELDTRLARALDHLRQAGLDDPELRNSVFTVTRYIDKVGEFPNGQIYRFEWEREWRVPNRLDLWPGGPLFLFAPESDHGWLGKVLAGQVKNGLRDGLPPLIDPAWEDDRIQQLLATLAR
jgi:Putative abortive phage resistance protein AbiGi, antitoxin